MTSFNIEEQNQVLDRLIESRHSIRKFKNDMPPTPMVEKILQAGLLAPYAKLSVTREDFRHFVVVPRESELTPRIASLIRRRSAALHNDLEKKMQQDEFQRSHGSPYLDRLKMIGQQGLPNLGTAPYYIVIAEQRGVPEVAELSIAHCLEWA